MPRKIEEADINQAEPVDFNDGAAREKFAWESPGVLTFGTPDQLIAEARLRSQAMGMTTDKEA